MESAGKAGVLIADDHPDVVRALTALLSVQPDFTPLGSARTSGELMDAVAMRHPDIVLVDWELPGFDPRQGVAALRRDGHGPQIVAMSGYVLAARAAIAAGADLFVSKTDPPDHVLATLRRLALGPIPAPNGHRRGPRATTGNVAGL
ncbi:MAG: response regulator [Thermoflexales bacterium]|nr:response regulator [Thermoflexales bacterium]